MLGSCLLYDFAICLTTVRRRLLRCSPRVTLELGLTSDGVFRFLRGHLQWLAWQYDFSSSMPF